MYVGPWGRARVLSCLVCRVVWSRLSRGVTGPLPGQLPGVYGTCYVTWQRVECRATQCALVPLNLLQHFGYTLCTVSIRAHCKNHHCAIDPTHVDQEPNATKQGPPPAGSGSRRGRRSSLPRAAPFLCAPCANAHHCARDCISRPIPHHRQRGRAASTTIAAAATASTASTASL